jgi:5'-methylthioadenosine phosphorylase
MSVDIAACYPMISIRQLDGVMAFRHVMARPCVSPSTVPRANIDALKRPGVTDIISVSACGSFREALRHPEIS